MKFIKREKLDKPQVSKKCNFYINLYEEDNDKLLQMAQQYNTSKADIVRQLLHTAGIIDTLNKYHLEGVTNE